MTENDFMRQQQAAVERMREMNARAAKAPGGNKMPPVPSFVRVPPQKDNQVKEETDSAKNTEKEIRKEPNGLFGTDIPFLGKLFKDSDSTLILGLLLILMSEKADKKLLFALVYILL